MTGGIRGPGGSRPSGGSGELGPILDATAAYYSEKLATHGATPQGADWNSAESQEQRFEALCRVCDTSSAFSLIDYGCGYGQLFEYLQERGCAVDYTGYDVSATMIQAAQRRFGAAPNCAFRAGRPEDTVADFVVASGILNVKQGFSLEAWEAYVYETIHDLDRVSRRGFAFNCLTSYSDPDRMQDTLYYADPAVLFDYCMRQFSRSVALLHDYGLFEFTILVHKPGLGRVAAA